MQLHASSAFCLFSVFLLSNLTRCLLPVNGDDDITEHHVRLGSSYGLACRGGAKNVSTNLRNRRGNERDRRWTERNRRRDERNGERVERNRRGNERNRRGNERNRRGNDGNRRGNEMNRRGNRRGNVVWSKESLGKPDVLRQRKFVLKLERAKPENSGIYHCNTSAATVFRHAVVVYSLPRIRLRASLIFNSASCERLIERELVISVAAILRRQTRCSARRVKAECRNRGVAQVTRYVLVTFDLTVRSPKTFISRLEEDVRRTCGNLSLPACAHRQQKHVLAACIDDVEQQVHEEENYQFLQKDLYFSSLKHNYSQVCPAGFRFSARLVCLPCIPGTSLVGQACVPCAKGTFQPHFAMTECDRCADGRTTRKAGSLLRSQCRAESVRKQVVQVLRRDDVRAELLAALLIACVAVIVIFVVVALR